MKSCATMGRENLFNDRKFLTCRHRREAHKISLKLMLGESFKYNYERDVCAPPAQRNKTLIIGESFHSIITRPEFNGLDKAAP